MRMVGPIIKLVETGRYQVTYLFQCRSDGEERQVRGFFAPYPQVSAIGICNRDRVNVKERDRRLGIPLEVFNTMDLAYYLELERLIQTEKFDLVQVEHSWMSWVVPLVHTVAPDLPVILDLHNVENTLLKRWIEYAEDDEREEMIARFEKMNRWERETWQWFDACLAVSPLEAEAYKSQTGCRIPTWELPTGGGIDLGRFRATTPETKRKRGAILWLGTVAWDANTHGLLWFMDEVMPLLKRTEPNVRLYIAGFGPPSAKLLSRLHGRKDIIFLGEQDDERQLLSQCQLFIVPLWVGAGARVKIPTAWAAGIPVVATTIGAEGLHYTDGEDILIADEPREFAEKVVMLMNDETLARRLSENGRATVERRYSLEYAVEQYDRIYSSLADRDHSISASRRVNYDFVELEKGIRQLLELKADIGVLIGVEVQANANGLKEFALSIQQSLGWRILTRYYRIVAKLLPPGTRRRSFYDLVLIGVRTIIDEGWRSFFGKAKRWTKGSVGTFMPYPVVRLMQRVLRHKGLNGYGLNMSQEAFRLKYQLEAARNDVLCQVLPSHIPPGTIIYDVGAYLGIYSILLAEKIPDSLIYAFEPNPDLFAKLVKNIELMGLKNRVIPLNFALDECCSIREFNISSDAARSSFYEYNATYHGNKVVKKVFVNGYSIDYLVASGICKPPDAIMIDVEGNEHRVVFGAKDVIMSKSPVIYFEPHGAGCHNLSTAEPVREFLTQFGYEFKDFGYPILCYKPARG